MWHKSIKYQVLLVLLVQCAALLAVVSSTLYLVNLRQHDYLILNLTGQLRVITRNLIAQSNHYIEQAPRDYETYNRDLGLFNKDLQMQVQAFDRIIQSLKARRIEADLFSRGTLSPIRDSGPKIRSLIDPEETIKCKWDLPARQQLDKTAAVWDKFHAGLKAALGNDPDGPRLEAAAQYILLNEHLLDVSTSELADTFRSMMENKLAQIKWLNQSGIVTLVLISLAIILILYYRVFQPIDRAVTGFHRVGRGDLAYRVPVYAQNEIGLMTETFNQLTHRLSTLFRLSDRINQADNLDDTLRFVYEEFPVFLPLDWAGVLRSSNNDSEYQLDRSYSETSFDLDVNERFHHQNALLAATLETGKPFCSCIDADTYPAWQNDAFIQRLLSNGLRSIFYLPLLNNPLDSAVLVLATQQADAYTADHMEFLTNIAGQVSHSFEKTIGMESLIVSTVKGLAKLAESRDPETGDHLFRMSHYSSLIAAELAKTDKYRRQITPNYIRDILTFAPMHDIGKVGISDSILLKPGKLDEEEFRQMQEHTTIGGDVLRRCELQMNAVGRSIFQIGIEIAEGHHEKFNGSGYPQQLKGEAIPLSARIVSVADVFDALTSKRPYKEAWPVEKAINYLDEESGRHFDPDIILAFKQALPHIMEIYDKHKHI